MSEIVFEAGVVVFSIVTVVNIVKLWRALDRAERRIAALYASIGGHMAHHAQSLDHRGDR